MCRAMAVPQASLGAALARLETRWGSATVRLGNGARIPTEGALAPRLEPEDTEPAEHPLAPLRSDVVSSGFPALDAALGSGGLPREASATIRGDLSSGKTTLALRWMAQAQAAGSIVAYLDLARSFDPYEAVCRGVDLGWLVIVRPADDAEGFAIGGALLAGRAVDLLVVDLPRRLPSAQEGSLRRLTAHARRIGGRMIVLEPLNVAPPVHGALAESASLRLELARAAWIHLGRDVVGQRTSVTVAKNRFGIPGREAELEIRYPDAPSARETAAPGRHHETGPPDVIRRIGRSGAVQIAPNTNEPRGVSPRVAGSTIPFRRVPSTVHHATPASRLATSPAPYRTATQRDRQRADRPRRPAVGTGHGARLQPAGAKAGSPPRPAARRGP
jgi:RecA/RadA recombinase